MDMSTSTPLTPVGAAAFKPYFESRLDEFTAGAQGLLSIAEHVCALNLNALRTALDEVEASSSAVFAAREPEALLDVEFDLCGHVQAQMFAYRRGWANVAGTAHAELLKVAESAVSHWLQGLIIGLEYFNRSLPLGGGMASNFVSRSAQLSATQVLSAYEQLAALGSNPLVALPALQD